MNETEEEVAQHRILGHCEVQAQVIPDLSSDIPGDQQRAIIVSSSKWVNGTVLHYAFIGGAESQRQAVRDAWQTWKDLGIGLVFTEVTALSEAEVRISFDHSPNAGSWSYVGRDVLRISVNQPTMNLGWDVTTPYGVSTALHEIGHTLGLPHEHQNPYAGIVWDEPRVYQYFAGSPNYWSAQQTYHNLLRKLSTTEVEGSQWDPDSIMQYQLPGGLILEPAQYSQGVSPPGTISEIDGEWARKWYPALEATAVKLSPFVSVSLRLEPTEQADFVIEPAASREYEIRTFGDADAVLVLFEEVDGEPRYIKGSDDGGKEQNASIKVKLFKGRRYIVRLRVSWVNGEGLSIMYW